MIIGLGSGNPGQLTLDAKKLLSCGRPLYFRTFKHPSARSFITSRMVCSFDHYYRKHDSFEDVYRAIIKSLVKAVRRYQTVYYAVPGHPDVGEATVEGLRKVALRLDIKIEIVPGTSFLEPLVSSLGLDMLNGFSIYDSLSLERLKEPSENNLILAQVYSRSLASEVKLKLLDLYPSDHPVKIIQAAGTKEEKVWDTPLYALDHRPYFNHLTSLYLPPYRGYRMSDLLDIMSRLRSDSGCPWDRQQTAHSLRQYVVEEAYEVIAAIESGSEDALQEELGDLLLQVVFLSQIAHEEGQFDFFRVIKGIAEKLIRRHPHVFGKEYARDAAAVKVLWEQIKSDENSKDKAKNILQIDHGLPALLKAYKLQKKAASVGFDWPCLDGPLGKAREELAELEEACSNNDQGAIEEELGDYLFTVVNIARFLGVNPELALGKTIGKFIKRFSYIVEQAELNGKSVTDYSLEELDQWWEKAKKIR